MTTSCHNLVKGYFWSILISNIIFVFLSFVVCLLLLFLTTIKTLLLILYGELHFSSCKNPLQKVKGEKQIKKFSYTFYSWSALIDRFLNLYKAFTPPWTSMEFRTYIMLNTDIRKSFKKLGVQVLIGLYLLCFSDSIIAQLFPFFNWHFTRSFQGIFVEQGELSATFRKCIYKWQFLWYNGNVGGCWKTALFFILRRRGAAASRKYEKTQTKNKRHSAACVTKKK